MTKEEHINRLKAIRNYCCAKNDIDSLDYAIKALEEQKTDVLEQIRAEIESKLQGVNTTLDVLVKDDALIPTIKTAKTTLEEVLNIFDKAIKEQTNEVS